jgi:hypothetical protein
MTNKTLLIITPGRKVKGDCLFHLLVAETGEHLASHLCSSASFAKSDLYSSREERIDEWEKRFGDVEVKFIDETDIDEDNLLRLNKQWHKSTGKNTGKDMEFDTTKIYVSPSKEMMSAFIGGEWKQFLRTDIVAEMQLKSNGADIIIVGDDGVGKAHTIASLKDCGDALINQTTKEAKQLHEIIEMDRGITINASHFPRTKKVKPNKKPYWKNGKLKYK